MSAPQNIHQDSDLDTAHAPRVGVMDPASGYARDSIGSPGKEVGTLRREPGNCCPPIEQERHRVTRGTPAARVSFRSFSELKEQFQKAGCSCGWLVGTFAGELARCHLTVDPECPVHGRES